MSEDTTGEARRVEEGIVAAVKEKSVGGLMGHHLDRSPGCLGRPITADGMAAR